MVKRSRRAVVIAASFALGLSCVGPYAHAGLLDGGDSGTSVEGLPLPVGGGLLDGVLGGGLPLDVLGDGLPLGVLDALPVGSLLGGGLPLDLLGTDLLGGALGLGLPVDDLLGGGLPLDVLGDDGPLGAVLSGDAGGLLAAEGVVEVVPDLGFIPGAGSISEILEAFSDSGSIVPGLQVLDEFGVLGILGSL